MGSPIVAGCLELDKEKRKVCKKNLKQFIDVIVYIENMKKEEYMLKNKVLDVIHKYNLIQKNSKLLVGVSGGPDSLVLLHFLKDIQATWGFDLLVAHVDHMFRGRSPMGTTFLWSKLVSSGASRLKAAEWMCLRT